MIVLYWIALVGVFSPAGNFGVALALLLYWIFLFQKPSLYEGVEKQISLEVPFVKGTPLGVVVDFTYTIVRASYLLSNAPIYLATR